LCLRARAGMQTLMQVNLEDCVTNSCASLFGIPFM